MLHAAVMTCHGPAHSLGVPAYNTGDIPHTGKKIKAHIGTRTALVFIQYRGNSGLNVITGPIECIVPRLHVVNNTACARQGERTPVMGHFEFGKLVRVGNPSLDRNLYQFIFIGLKLHSYYHPFTTFKFEIRIPKTVSK